MVQTYQTAVVAAAAVNAQRINYKIAACFTGGYLIINLVYECGKV